MGSQRILGEINGLSNSSTHQLPYYPIFHGINNNNNPSTGFLNQEGSSAFDFGELEEAIVLQGVKLGNDEAKPPHFIAERPAATLEMFPSWPIKIHQIQRLSGEGEDQESTDGDDSGGSANNNLNTTTLTKTKTELELPDSPMSSSKRAFSSSSNYHHPLPLPLPLPHHHHHHLLQLQHFQSDHQMENQTLRTEPSQDQSSANLHHLQLKRKGAAAGSTSERQLDAKTERRLAQNREAARKSRLRKKAYIQQLESSRIKLSQLEQDLHRARSQGLFLGGGGAGGNISSGAALFDMEYARWLDNDHRLMAELRTGLHGQVADGDLRAIVDSYIRHYDEIFDLKGVAAKSDVFHLITGMWMTPAERCFLWIGGFRPSKLIEMLIPQLDTLTEQQAMRICELQQSSHETEDALYQGLEQLHHSLIITIAGSTTVIDGMNHMAVAAGKLANLEGFIRQADMLRQETLHQLRRILTVRQAGRCFLVIGEYYARLRALSSLWVSRPRESYMNEEISCQTTTELHMIQNSHNHFPNF